MAKRSVTKQNPQVVLTYNHKANCAFRRLPFINKRGPGEWDVPATGGYQGGCEMGKWAAVAYLKYLRGESESGGGGVLQHIALSMAERSSDSEAFTGQLVGFFGELCNRLLPASKHMHDLDNYSENDLAEAMTRAVNFNEKA